MFENEDKIFIKNQLLHRACRGLTNLVGNLEYDDLTEQSTRIDDNVIVDAVSDVTDTGWWHGLYTPVSCALFVSSYLAINMSLASARPADRNPTYVHSQIQITPNNHRIRFLEALNKQKYNSSHIFRSNFSYVVSITLCLAIMSEKKVRI